MNTMNYDTMGACGPLGCPAPGYGAYPYGYGAAAPIAPFWGGNVVRTDIIGRQPPMVAQAPAPAPAQVGRGLSHWDIVGQEPAQESWFNRTGPLGIQNKWWLAGSAAIGLTWLAYSQGWFGGMLGGRRSRDFDDVSGDFFF